MGREGAGRDMQTCVEGGEGCASPVRVYLALDSAHLRVPLVSSPRRSWLSQGAVERLVGTRSGAIQSGVSRAVCYKYLI